MENLLDLPLENILNVLKHMTINDLIRATQVPKNYKGVDEVDEEIKQDLTQVIEKDEQKTAIPQTVSVGEITTSTASAKGQLISKCPFGVIVWTKIPTKNFPVFLP